MKLNMQVSQCPEKCLVTVTDLTDNAQPSFEPHCSNTSTTLYAGNGCSTPALELKRFYNISIGAGNAEKSGISIGNLTISE